MKLRANRLILGFFLILAIIAWTSGTIITRLNTPIPNLQGASDNEERILNIAKYIARTFSDQIPGSSYFGALYSHRLPELIRLPTGILEAITHPSDCDSMVRALIYFATREGIKTRQSDIFTPTFIHSVAEAFIDDRWILVDPYHGIVFRNANGELADFKTIRKSYSTLKQEGLRVQNTVATSAKFFYGRLNSSIIATSWQEVAIPLSLPAKVLPKIIGVLDESSEDLETALISGEMGLIGSFLGPQFGSGRHTRIKLIDKPQNTDVTVIFELTEKSVTPPFAISSLPNICISGPGYLECHVPKGHQEVVIEHGNWNHVFSVDRILLGLRE